MSEAVIAELETAARIVMQPPNQISTEQRKMAENVIMKFQRTPSPYVICREILEKSDCQMLIFEVASTLKRSIVSEWKQLQEEDREVLQAYLLRYCLERDMPSFIRSKLLQVVAIIVKRTHTTESTAELAKFMSQINEMIMKGDLPQQYLGCKTLYAVMQEFMVTIKSDDTGLTFEQHFRAKKLFELGELKRIFVMIFQAVEKLLATAGELQNEHVQLLDEYLIIAEIILSWGYVSPLLPNRLVNALEMNSKMDQSPALRLSAQWSQVILEPAVLKLFFEIYWKVRDIPELQRKGLNCIVQFSTLNGPVINQPQTRTAYVSNYMTHLLQLVASRPLMATEAHGISVAFRKILLHTNENSWIGVPEEIRNMMLQQMFSITCTFMDMAVRKESEEEERFKPALEVILESWLLVLNLRRSFTTETLQQYSVQMFNKYLQSHLSYAATNGGGIATDPSKPFTNSFDSSDDDDQLTENERYEEQLIIIGMFGREHLACTLPTLCTLLEERTATLREQLLRIYTAQSVQATDSQVLEIIYDDILWIVMVAGHVLSMNTNGDEPLIPLEIRKFCLERQKQGQTDLTASLSLLAAPGQTVAEIANAETGADLVVRLVAAVFRLCDLENKAIELKMMSVLSPEVCRNNMWFIELWGSTYLLEPYTIATSNQSDLIKEAEIADSVSIALKQSFGNGTDGGKWTLEFVLNKICVNVRNFSGEPKLVEASLRIFNSLTKNAAKAPVVFQSEFFKQVSDLRHLEIPKANLLRGLTTISSCVTPIELRCAYLQELIAPIDQSFKNLGWQHTMAGNNNEAKSATAIRLAYILDEMRACCLGATCAVAQTIYEMFKQMLYNLVDVLDQFRNFQTVVVAIFELLCTAVERLRGPGTEYNEICIRVVRVYVRNNAQRVSFEQNAEEDSLEDLLLLLKLSKNFLNAAVFDVASDLNDGEEVCSAILQYILPMITHDMLKYPAFCLSFYQTLKMFVDKSIMQLQPDFMSAIIECAKMGLQQFGAEIQAVCLLLFTVLSLSVYYDQNPDSFMYSALRPCVHLVFTMVLQHDIDTDNRTECCSALFTLLCAYRMHYDDIIAGVLQSYADESKKEVLRKELNDLTQSDQLYNNRACQVAFSKRFEKFMANLSALF